MDVRIRERLIGALVLVALIVLFVPALLKGPGSSSSKQEPPQPTKSVEIPLADAEGSAPVDRLVPEPEAAQARLEVPAGAPQKFDEPASPPPSDSAPERLESPVLPPAAAPAIPPAAPAAAPPTAWAVQLGAFSTRSKAEGLVAKLRSRGYSAFVLEYRAGGQLLHRVRVGPEQDRARAVAIAERLRADGYQPVVAPHP